MHEHKIEINDNIDLRNCAILEAGITYGTSRALLTGVTIMPSSHWVAKVAYWLYTNIEPKVKRVRRFCA